MGIAGLAEATAGPAFATCAGLLNYAVTADQDAPLEAAVEIGEVEASLRRLGFQRILVGEEVREVSGEILSEAHPLLRVLIDRGVIRPRSRDRLIESIEQALHFGKGRLTAHVETEGGRRRLSFSEDFHCPSCDIHYPDPVPNLFSFNNPLGACESCKGFGKLEASGELGRDRQTNGI